MKRLVLIVVVCVIAKFLNAGNGIGSNAPIASKLVSGKVIDKKSGEEIAGAEIKIADKTIYSDLNGNFSAMINPVQTEAVVSFISYDETIIKIDPFSYAEITIELESK